jgi:hypothetical protein
VGPRHGKKGPPWWVLGIFRKVGLFLLACLVGFVILILAMIPVLFAIWQLMLYAAKQ